MLSKNPTKIKSVKVTNKRLIKQIVKPISVRVVKMSKKEEEKKKTTRELRSRNKVISYEEFLEIEIQPVDKYKSKNVPQCDADSTKWNPRVSLVNLGEIINIKNFKTFSAKKVIKLINDSKESSK